MRGGSFIIAGGIALLSSSALIAQPVQQPFQTGEEVAIALAPLAAISALPARIATANVKDSAGMIVGAVQRVELANDGTAKRVDVALIGKKVHVISLDPSQLTYDAANNEILARTSAAQMRALPNRS